MNKLHIDLSEIIQELTLGAFRTPTENDRSYFDGAVNCLVAEIHRGKFHYLVLWDYVECEIQVFDGSAEERGDEFPGAWSINTVTGVVSEL